MSLSSKSFVLRHSCGKIRVKRIGHTVDELLTKNRSYRGYNKLYVVSRAELERIAEEEAAKIAQMEAEADGISEPVTEEVMPEENNGAEIAEEENNENTNE